MDGKKGGAMMKQDKKELMVSENFDRLDNLDTINGGCFLPYVETFLTNGLIYSTANISYKNSKKARATRIA